jgi:hypothetical protein
MLCLSGQQHISYAGFNLIEISIRASVQTERHGMDGAFLFMPRFRKTAKCGGALPILPLVLVGSAQAE